MRTEETPKEEIRTKRCAQCKVHKPISEFCPRGDNYPGLYHSYCKLCFVERRCSNRDSRRRSHWLYRYGMTEREYNELLDRQQHRCAICRTETPGKLLHVDHCHQNNRIRGLLCGACNRALGIFQDSVVNLSNAIIYLCQARM